jgi:transcription-repair coupling factor (superfamily II helicase)
LNFLHNFHKYQFSLKKLVAFSILVLDNHSFDNWPKGDLLELLTKSCPEFDIKLWCDNLSKIKEFAAQNFISSNATELTAYRAINIRYEHERYQNLSNQLSSICNDFERFYENWWVEATKQKINKTAEIIADMESLNDYIKPNLNQRESKILVIGDTGVGKRDRNVPTIVNFILFLVSFFT